MTVEIDDLPWYRFIMRLKLHTFLFVVFCSSSWLTLCEWMNVVCSPSFRSISMLSLFRTHLARHFTVRLVHSPIHYQRWMEMFRNNRDIILFRYNRMHRETTSCIANVCRLFFPNHAIELAVIPFKIHEKRRTSHSDFDSCEKLTWSQKMCLKQLYRFQTTTYDMLQLSCKSNSFSNNIVYRKQIEVCYRQDIYD